MPTEVTAFCEGMTALVKEGSYAEGLTAVLSAEWSYGQVSLRLLSGGIPDALLDEWFALHIQPTFMKGIDWIEYELERTVPYASCTEDHFASLSDTFLHAIRLEIDFHRQPLKVS